MAAMIKDRVMVVGAIAARAAKARVVAVAATLLANATRVRAARVRVASKPYTNLLPLLLQSWDWDHQHVP
jgi:hypothetical protein